MRKSSTEANGTSEGGRLGFPGLGQSKHKCPNRLRKLIGLIDGYQVPAIANDLDVCSRNSGLYFTPVLLQRILPVLVSR